MNKLSQLPRVFLGLIFSVFGFNYFVPFIPHPEITGDALVYMQGLTTAGYFWPLLRSIELVAGIALLSNRYVPLALTLLGPITLHIFLFHAFLLPANLVLAVLMVAAHALLIIKYKASFAPLFKSDSVNREVKSPKIKKVATA